MVNRWAAAWATVIVGITVAFVGLDFWALSKWPRVVAIIDVGLLSGYAIAICWVAWYRSLRK